MKILAQFEQTNLTSIQVVLVEDGVYMSESLRESPDGEFVSGQAIQVSPENLDRMIYALRQAKAELAARFEAAAE